MIYHIKRKKNINKNINKSHKIKYIDGEGMKALCSFFFTHLVNFK